MASNKKSGETLRKTMIAKHGSEEAYREYMREVGRKGGLLSKGGGFAKMPKEKVREAARKGGTISRRTGVKNAKTT